MKIKDLIVEESKWTPKTIANWVKDHWDANFLEIDFAPNENDVELLQNGHVKFKKNIALDLDYKDLPFMIDDIAGIRTSVNGSNTLSLYHPKSLHGCPKNVGYFSVANNHSNFSFDGCPESMEELWIDAVSCRDIHKHINKAEKINISYNVKSNILGILLIPAVTYVRVVSHWDDDAKTIQSGPIRSAVKILKKYLGQGKQGIVKAQREMLDFDVDDLEAFAEM